MKQAMKKLKLRYKAALPLILAAILSCISIAAFSVSGGRVLSVRAEDSAGSTEGNTGDEAESSAGSGIGDGAENSADSEAGNGAEDGGESGTVSGNDVEPLCTCEDKCGAYEYDHGCAVCAEDYKLCAYKKPNVVISIHKPDGWYTEKAAVTFSVSDTAHTGNFEMAKMQTKVGQGGSWLDVTEDKKLEISENCTVYVQITDQKGNTYEKSRAIRCFDTVKPTLNAAVSAGLLSIQAHDTDSGTKAVYVNGYEFTELTNGAVSIRLQQFDTGYEYFTISAMDNAGNMSEVYKTKNPYYQSGAEENGGNPAEQLPVSAQATKPGNATGTVTEHVKTDNDGNSVTLTAEEQKKQAFAEADAAETAKSEGMESTPSEKGKEFYTIQTASDKVFYLIIDRDGEEELVYFLTEITENDLLNVTSDNSETLPKNSAALESAIPVPEGALMNNNGEAAEDTKQAEENDGGAETAEDGENAEKAEPEETEPEETEEPGPLASYILMGIFAAGFIGGAYYFKIRRRKKEDFIEDEDEDMEEEEYEDEEETEDDPEEDFFSEESGR